MYAVGVTVNAGVLKISNASSISSANAIRINSGGNLDLNGQTISNPIRLNGGTLINSASAASVVSGAVVITSS